MAQWMKVLRAVAVFLPLVLFEALYVVAILASDTVPFPDTDVGLWDAVGTLFHAERAAFDFDLGDWWFAAFVPVSVVLFVIWYRTRRVWPSVVARRAAFDFDLGDWWFAAFVPVSVVLFVIWYRTRRVWPSVVAMLIPSAMFIPYVPLLFLLVFFALPMISIPIGVDVIRGALDGEDWVDFHVAAALLGWWQIAWMVTLAYAITRRFREQYFKTLGGEAPGSAAR